MSAPKSWRPVQGRSVGFCSTSSTLFWTWRQFQWSERPPALFQYQRRLSQQSSKTIDLLPLHSISPRPRGTQAEQGKKAAIKVLAACLSLWIWGWRGHNTPALTNYTSVRQGREDYEDHVLWFLVCIYNKHSLGLIYFVRNLKRLRWRHTQLPGPKTRLATKRPQFVRLKGQLSKQVVNSTGAPDRTVLSAFLFNLNTSDFKKDSPVICRNI